MKRLGHFQRCSARVGLSLSFAFALSACGSDDEDAGFARDVSGEYSLSITNGTSTCEQDWDEGEMRTGLRFTITQRDEDVTGTVEGLEGAYLGLVIGTREFEGTADGNALSMVAYGTIPRTEGNCTFTLNATLEGRLSDDTVEGTIRYAPATNENPDCTSVECASVQNFTGSRPPR